VIISTSEAKHLSRMPASPHFVLVAKAWPFRSICEGSVRTRFCERDACAAPPCPFIFQQENKRFLRFQPTITLLFFGRLASPSCSFRFFTPQTPSSLTRSSCSCNGRCMRGNCHHRNGWITAASCCRSATIDRSMIHHRLLEHHGSTHTQHSTSRTPPRASITVAMDGGAVASLTGANDAHALRASSRTAAAAYAASSVSI
jgi:hypothetical protein